MNPDEMARACAQVMRDDDPASQRLGMVLDHIAPGHATLSMEVAPSMANGQGNGHGGFIFMLADSAFAFACNTYNAVTVGQHCSISYLAPVRIGDRLTATAREVSRRGRSGLYDVRITNQHGEHIAEFRGASRMASGQHLPPAFS